MDDDSPDGRCVYLNYIRDKSWCGIYHSRPNACRAFPFTLRITEGGSYRLMIHTKCRGFGKGRKINIKNRIRDCIRNANRQFGKRWRIDFSGYEENGSVSIVK